MPGSRCSIPRRWYQVCHPEFRSPRPKTEIFTLLPHQQKVWPRILAIRTIRAVDFLESARLAASILQIKDHAVGISRFAPATLRPWECQSALSDEFPGIPRTYSYHAISTCGTTREVTGLALTSLCRRPVMKAKARVMGHWQWAIGVAH